MEDHELRGRLDDLEEAIARLELASGRVSEVLTSMRIGDSDARGDVKIALAELRTSATAMRDTALSLQKSELQGVARKLSGADLWLVRIAAGSIAIALLALGGKEIVAKLLGQ
jgi:hypothetical protein